MAFAASALIGCGDSSVECGEGTTENDDGFCVPTGGDPVTCTDGTMLDQATNTCVIDPASCQDGTVLIGNACVDPTAGLTVDTTEAAEPNGFGVGGESSADPAGEFQLKPIGQKVVLQGNLTPRPDRNEDGQLEGDLDTYLFETDGATLVDISVDGVGGAAGGFVMFGAIDGLETWVRFGVNLTGDTSKRQVFLPSAGVYLLAIADTRTLVLAEAAGDAQNKYFVSIEKKAIPTATNLTFTNGDAVAFGTVDNNEVEFYTGAWGEGINSADLQSFDPDFDASLVLTIGAAVRSVTTETHSPGGAGDAPATARFGVATGQSAILVVDHRINTGHTSAQYRLHARTRAGKALKTDGTTETQNNINPAVSNLDGHTFWYFDVNSTDALTGFNLSWNTPVIGVLTDDLGNTVSTFTSLTSLTNRWSGYKGLIRTRAPGRYYFEVFAPAILAGAPIVATSTIAPVTSATLTFNTPVTDVAVNAFNGNPYTYGTGGTPWQLISFGADTATTGATLRVFNPLTAVGRLGALTTVNASGTQATSQPSGSLLTLPTAANASIDQGYVMLGLPENVLMVASATAATGTFDLGTAARVFTDEGNHAGPYTVTHTAVASAADSDQRYLLRTPPGHKITITVTPNVDVDPEITALNDDESPFDGADSGFEGDPETFEFTMDNVGYLAFNVHNYFDDGTYDITITVTAPAPLFYTAAASTTLWTNVCTATGSTDVPLTNRDDSLTNVIVLPTPFTFYGVAKTSIRISTNGWFTFDTAATDSQNLPAPFPSDTDLFGDPDTNDKIAPYWDDLINVRLCTATSGTKFIIQWRGTPFGATDEIAMQAILDTSDGSIEFVYAPYMESDGTFQSAGVENADASQGTSVFFFENDPIDLAGTSVKLTHL